MRTVAEIEEELAVAKSSLESWQDYDMHREDGSMAQDVRHERLGR